MASSETKPTPCLMCLDAPAVHTADVCQHSFCETCLKSYQEENGSKSCPACKGQCTQTDTQAKMDDEDGKTDGQTVGTARSEGGTLKTIDDEVIPNPLKCTICLIRGIEARATKVCLDCQDIPMCTNCHQDHRKSKLTQNHVHSLLSNSEVIDIQTALEYEKGRLAMLESDEAYLKEAKSTSENMESTLIKSIEDHTETVIGQAITNKEILKKKVRCTFKVIGVFVKCLAAMPELLKASKDIIARTDRVLHDGAELDSAYVEKRRRLEQDLGDLKQDVHGYAKGKEAYKEAYENLCGEPMVFYPRSPNMNVGGFQDLELGLKCYAGGSCVCETCQKKFALPDENRVHECRTKAICTCGTCGAGFFRDSFYRRNRYLDRGYCNKNIGDLMAKPYYF